MGERLQLVSDCESEDTANHISYQRIYVKHIIKHCFFYFIFQESNSVPKPPATSAPAAEQSKMRRRRRLSKLVIGTTATDRRVAH